MSNELVAQLLLFKHPPLASYNVGQGEVSASPVLTNRIEATSTALEKICWRNGFRLSLPPFPNSSKAS